MIGFTELAVNLYQISFLDATPQPIVGILVYVELSIVPDVFVHSPDDDSVIAPAQRSLGGGGLVIQILKVPAAFGSLYTRT